MAVLARQGSREPGTYALVSSIGNPDRVRGIDSFLRRYFVYREERDEVLRDVPFMLNDLDTLGHMEGDCDDMCIMACALLKSAGFPLVRMTAIQSDNPFEYDHVFSEVRISDFWLPVDPTVPYGTTYQQFGFMSEAV
jgi:transglutaminase-like putative cysteine protease